MKQILLTQGKCAIVDDEDFNTLSQYQWNASQYKNSKTWYAKRNNRVNGHQVTILMHRQIMNAKQGLSVDHINHNGLDNQKHNLRLCSHKENMFNRTPDKNTSSCFKGVYWCKNISKWRSYITIDNKKVMLGCFESEIEAAKAYDLQASKNFGEFANLNLRKESHGRQEARECRQLQTA